MQANNRLFEHCDHSPGSLIMLRLPPLLPLPAWQNALQVQEAREAEVGWKDSLSKPWASEVCQLGMVAQRPLAPPSAHASSRCLHVCAVVPSLPVSRSPGLGALHPQSASGAVVLWPRW
jgi:hypothetical protein